MRPSPAVRVVRTSTANLAAVVAAFRRLGREVQLTHDPSDVLEGEHVVLPGVGAFGAARSAVVEHGLDEALRLRIREGRPTLAICLGLQLLAEGSEEDPGTSGLGLIPGVSRSFDPGAVRVPHMGWNEVRSGSGSAIVRSGFAYFAHTYRLTSEPPGWATAMTDYDGPFVAAVEKGAVVACQFHPELSGAYGSGLLSSWLEAEAC